MVSPPDCSHWYTTLVLQTGIGHSWKRTIPWVLAHSAITSAFIFAAGLAENILYDAWTYVWFGAWICFVFIVRRSTSGLAELLGVPTEECHFYTANIYKNTKKEGNNILADTNISNTANKFLYQPGELILGFVAYMLFIIGFIPWSYETGLFGELPYPWFNYVLYTNLIFFFFDYLLFASAIFLVVSLLYSLWRYNIDTENKKIATKKEITNKNLQLSEVTKKVLEHPTQIRKIGHVVADVTLGAFGLVLLLELYWAISNTMKGVGFSWTGLILLGPLLFGTLIAFIWPQKKLHDALSPYWDYIKENFPALFTVKYGILSHEDMGTTVLENSRRYKFGILMIFIFGCALIDYHLFQLIGLEIWTAVGIQLAVMAGLMQGWQFME